MKSFSFKSIATYHPWGAPVVGEHLSMSCNGFIISEWKEGDYTKEEKMFLFKRFMNNKPIEVDQYIPEVVKNMIKENFDKISLLITWEEQIDLAGIVINYLEFKVNDKPITEG